MYPSRVTPDPEDLRAMSDHERTADREQIISLYAGRLASRYDDDRIRRDVELHCRMTLAEVRYSVPYAELAPRQQNAVNREVAAVVNTLLARYTDREFLYLSHDQRAIMEPERHAKSGGVQ